MQPRTDVKFDLDSFNRLMRTVKNMSVTNKKRFMDSSYAAPIPEEVGIQLTNRCNLRCRQCFQWNEDGVFHKLDKETQNIDIDFNLIQNIFSYTSSAKSNLYLWGGEPLCYKHWDSLAGLLENDPRWTILCTNGILIKEKKDSIIKISSNLVILLSLDGFEAENDSMRGKGTFKKVVEAIDLIIELKRKGIYKGEISVNCVISDSMVGKLYDFMEFMEQKGINTLYFCFPWYISNEDACKMDTFFKEKFDWLLKTPEEYKGSWHSYSYRLSENVHDTLHDDIKRINERIWKIRVRYQPALEPHEIDDFLLGKDKTAQKKNSCMAISTRLNVMADGNVTACKLFHEFIVGDLNTANVNELWNSEKFRKVREAIGCGLMPVCSKCVLLYLHGI